MATILAMANSQTEAILTEYQSALANRLKLLAEEFAPHKKEKAIKLTNLILFEAFEEFKSISRARLTQSLRENLSSSMTFPNDIFMEDIDARQKFVDSSVLLHAGAWSTQNPKLLSPSKRTLMIRPSRNRITGSLCRSLKESQKLSKNSETKRHVHHERSTVMAPPTPHSASFLRRKLKGSQTVDGLPGQIVHVPDELFDPTASDSDIDADIVPVKQLENGELIFVPQEHHSDNLSNNLLSECKLPFPKPTIIKAVPKPRVASRNIKSEDHIHRATSRLNDLVDVKVFATEDLEAYWEAIRNCKQYQGKGRAPSSVVKFEGRRSHSSGIKAARMRSSQGERSPGKQTRPLRRSSRLAKRVTHVV